MRLVTVLLFALLATTAAHAGPASGMYTDLGHYHRQVTTSSATAARWFDQGLVLMYAFNHDEAIRCFTEASKADPELAMAWWGIAAANGPHINNTSVPAERDTQARAAMQRARALASKASPVEQALIEAQHERWGSEPSADRRPLDEAYAAAMQQVWQRFPKDADVGALTAEALMDLQPWDLWTRAGEPKGNTLTIVSILEQTLALDRDHPMACHLYVHALEASSTPSKGLAAADALVGLMPGSGHMEHMPSHLYIRTGRLRDAITSNERAMAADSKHRDRMSPKGFIQVYVAHDAHFLAFAHMLDGNAAGARAAADSMIRRVPAEFMSEAMPVIDGYLPVREHVMVRFGQWDAILAAPSYPREAQVANAVHHYARGVAFTALTRFDEARAELAALDSAIANIDGRYIGNNPARMVLRVPRGLLAGELAFAQGDRDAGLALAGAAVATEDSLVYDEPPDWMMPARHSYGAMLLEAKRWSDAERVFREDLTMYPENGWSLFGLTRALRAQGQEKQARGTEKRFQKAWQRSDTSIRTSCMCQPGTGPGVDTR
jgi:tetratricopeptide (TPR) repeat protein